MDALPAGQDPTSNLDANKVNGYDFIIIDEAQDFTPCQASAFFNQCRNGAIVYMVGDARQRMYRWRGARDSFETASVSAEFTLSESFRFGPDVAKVANAVLDFASCGAGGVRVVGHGDPLTRVLEPGAVIRLAPGGRAGLVTVVIARTNKGMFNELVRRILRTQNVAQVRWGFLDQKMGEHLLKEDAFMPYLKLRRAGGPVSLMG